MGMRPPFGPPRSPPRLTKFLYQFARPAPFPILRACARASSAPACVHDSFPQFQLARVIHDGGIIRPWAEFVIRSSRATFLCAVRYRGRNGSSASVTSSQLSSGNRRAANTRGMLSSYMTLPRYIVPRYLLGETAIRDCITHGSEARTAKESWQERTEWRPATRITAR